MSTVMIPLSDRVTKKASDIPDQSHGWFHSYHLFEIFQFLKNTKSAIKYDTNWSISSIVNFQM